MSLLYDVKLDRRTVYSAIALLMDMGYDISDYADNEIGYYLRQGDFEDSEITLLTEAVYSFPFLPAKYSQDLIKKLQKQVSVHKRKHYHHLSIIRQKRKTDNQEVFLNIDILDQAIQEKKQVSLSYMKYGLDKKLQPRRKEPYILNPYGMVYTNEHYYLICTYAGSSTIGHYRIDRMKHIEILDIPRERQPKEEILNTNAIYAFGGKPEYVKMKCQHYILDDVIDRFGTGIRIRELNEKEFEVTMTIPPKGLHFWALQYLPHVEVIEPAWLREEIINSINNNPYGL